MQRIKPAVFLLAKSHMIDAAKEDLPAVLGEVTRAVRAAGMKFNAPVAAKYFKKVPSADGEGANQLTLTIE